MPSEYKPREFSTKQSIMLDNVTANLLDIDDKARAAILAAQHGDMAGVIINNADIRNLAIDARAKIGNARRGEYDDK